MSSAQSDVLIVLPSGPALHADLPSSNALSNATNLLARFSEALPSTTLISLNYRLSFPRYPYPIPILDTATAFTYIADQCSDHNAGTAPKISIIGSHIGGSLALMLALTSPNLIRAVHVSDPFVDWVGLDEAKSKAKESSTEDALAYLLTMRSRLFRTPSAYFDPFASPILFLRAPGRDTPTTHSSPLTKNEDDLYPETNSDADAYRPYDDDMTSAVGYAPPKRRKVLRRWPPVPGDVVLPYTRIMVSEGGGLNAVLRDQGREMADVMRKACFWGSEKGVGEERVKTDVLAVGKSVLDEMVYQLEQDRRNWAP